MEKELGSVGGRGKKDQGPTYLAIISYIQYGSAKLASQLCSMWI